MPELYCIKKMQSIPQKYMEITENKAIKLGTNDRKTVPKCQSTQEHEPEPLGNL